MKMLISNTELDSKGSRDLIPLECYQCGKTHYRTKNIIQRILNGNHYGTGKGNFCSHKCQHDNKKKPRLECVCQECKIPLLRLQTDIGKNIFCSKSCSATFFNKTKVSKKACAECKTEFHPYRGSNKMKYCSSKCSSVSRRNRVFEQIKSGNVTGHASSTMRRFLIATRGQKCEICGITEWRGQPLVVIMDHIDGNSQNWNLSNLRLICSNCDTLTSTYKSKNKGNGRHNRRLRYAQGKSF